MLNRAFKLCCSLCHSVESVLYAFAFAQWPVDCNLIHGSYKIKDQTTTDVGAKIFANSKDDRNSLAASQHLRSTEKTWVDTPVAPWGRSSPATPPQRRTNKMISIQRGSPVARQARIFFSFCQKSKSPQFLITSAHQVEILRYNYLQGEHLNMTREYLRLRCMLGVSGEIFK